MTPPPPPIYPWTLVGTPAPEGESELVRLAARATQIALSEIGRGEFGRNNAGPDVERYRRHDGTGGGVGGYGAWCASFTSYCYETAAADLRLVLPFTTSRGAKRLTRNIARAGRWVIESPHARVAPAQGDVICWHRGTGAGDWRGHVGIVLGYCAETDYLRAVEGNRGAYPSRVQVLAYPDGAWRKRLYGVARLA